MRADYKNTVAVLAMLVHVAALCMANTGDTTSQVTPDLQSQERDARMLADDPAKQLPRRHLQDGALLKNAVASTLETQVPCGHMLQCLANDLPASPLVDDSTVTMSYVVCQDTYVGCNGNPDHAHSVLDSLELETAIELYDHNRGTDSESHRKERSATAWCALGTVAACGIACAFSIGTACAPCIVSFAAICGVVAAYEVTHDYGTHTAIGGPQPHIPTHPAAIQHDSVVLPIPLQDLQHCRFGMRTKRTVSHGFRAKHMVTDPISWNLLLNGQYPQFLLRQWGPNNANNPNAFMYNRPINSFIDLTNNNDNNRFMQNTNVIPCNSNPFYMGNYNVITIRTGTTGYMLDNARTGNRCVFVQAVTQGHAVHLSHAMNGCGLPPPGSIHNEITNERIFVVVLNPIIKPILKLQLAS